MIKIEKCINQIIEREGLKADADNIHYRNNELECAVHSNFESMSITFLGEQSLDKKNKVKIQQYGTETEDKFIRFSFYFENGEYVWVEIHYDENIEMEFYGCGKPSVSCHLLDDSAEMFWWEPEPEFRKKLGRVDEYGAGKLADRICDVILDGRDNAKFDKLYDVVRPALIQAILEIGIRGLHSFYYKLDRKNNELRKLNGVLSNEDAHQERYIENYKKRRAELLKEIEELCEIINKIQCNLQKEYAPFVKERDESIGKYIEEFIRQEKMQLIDTRDLGRRDLYLDVKSGQVCTAQKDEDSICLICGTEETGILKISDCGSEGVELDLDFSEICDCTLKINVNQKQIIIEYDYYHGDRGKFYIDYDKHGEHIGEVYTFEMTSDDGRAIRYVHPSRIVEDSTIDGIANLICNICRMGILDEGNKEHAKDLMENRMYLNDMLLRIGVVLKSSIRDAFMLGRINTLVNAAEEKRNLLSSELDSNKYETMRQEISRLENMAGDVLNDIKGENAMKA